jgi:peptidoglycan/LPS O-acetylase OafA/YrhL
LLKPSPGIGIMAASKRDTALDGLRGWAAIAVCLYHFFWELFGAKYPEFRNLGTAIFCNGRLAVSIFFVLTGYVLTVGAWGMDKGPVRRQLLKRYFRLTIPIIFAVAITMVAIDLHLDGDMVAAGTVVNRPDWLGNFLQFEPSVAGATAFAFALVYWPIAVELSYNAFLWTMPYEFLGSYLVLLICLTERAVRVPLAFLGVLAGAMLAGGDFWALGAPFALGACLAIMRQQGLLPTSRGWGPIAVVALAVALGGVVQWLSLPVWMIELPSSAVVAAVLSSERMGVWLSSSVSCHLGRLSYPIYLMQFPVLITLSSTLIMGAQNGGFLSPTIAIAIAISSLTAVIILALPFYWVERLTAVVGRTLDRTMSRRPAAI